METVVTVSVIVVMIAMGMLVIHTLNVRHAQRIATFHYSDAVPGIRRRGRKGRQPSGRSPAPPPPSP
ncbi:hypothetical protein [Streptomyces peucetius]|uniref:Secreted protein n=1 Tax=Streptomyces peucetius TaxID=1950 RepID=A0ABY6I8R5_STRPE|nr:hypothetical protein [Streptomyces peucetius]UYQ63395.1 hypothetical protein OGH68_19285 [Streptomyces peucetius]